MAAAVTFRRRDVGGDLMHDEHRYLAETLRGQVMRLEQMLSADVHLPDCFEDVHLPAWLRRTEGEQRLPVSLAALGAIALQTVLPRRFALQPHLLLPVL